MVDASPAQIGPPLAELTWNQRAIRRLRILTVLHAAFSGILFLASLLLPGLWRLSALLFATHLGVRLYLTWLLFSVDLQELLQVHERGLYLKTERAEAFVPWDQVEGFAGVIRRRPSPTAPRTTTGGLSLSLALRAGGRWIDLSRPSSGNLETAVRVIEEKLAEH
ncbi:MAG TPA: hypothetical protein VGM19_14430 [Armatimonadota bacterium]